MKNFLRDLFIYNSFIVFNVYGILVDIFYYIKAIKTFKLLKKKQYEKFTLKTDWIGMGYLVINYGENFFDDLTEYQQEMWIFNDIAKLNEDIAKADLLDSLKNKYRLITIDGEPTSSIEVEYKPYFYHISFWILLRSIIVYTGLFIFLFGGF